jgi:hypothetical protein
MAYAPLTTTRTTIVVRTGSRGWVDLVLHGGSARVSVNVLGWWSA